MTIQKNQDINFERKIYDELLQWKKDNDAMPSGQKKAARIDGARRVGKTTIAERFARTEYESYRLVDFSFPQDEIRDALEKKNIGRFFEILSSDVTQDPLYPHRSAIILDEVQFCPAARECIDALVSEGSYDYIETGSLISVKTNSESIKLPAMERQLCMYPMGFDEFCRALGEDGLIENIRVSFDECRPVEEKNHKNAMRLFREYMFVGGMPQAVRAFIIDCGKDENKLKKVDTEKRDILHLYEEDIKKMNSKSPAVNLTSTFDSIPELLSKHNWDGWDGEKYVEAFNCFREAMICNICKKSNDPGVDSNSSADSRYEKCYMGDTGLFQCLRVTDKTMLTDEMFSRLVNDRLHTNEGQTYENIVSQMLVCAGYKDLNFFYKKADDENGHNIEIDFLISRRDNENARICPIEVKSETGYKTKSLIRFKDRYSTSKKVGTGIVVLPDNLRYDREKDILYIPSYMVFCL